jgi:hypothetical protein
MTLVASAESTMIGVTGQQSRASVTTWGDVTLHIADRDSPTLKWFVAADDRWHIPGDEVTVRQIRIEGTPVLETRLRIPDGDAVQRVWSVADLGGLTIVEVENDSPLPFAVAFSGPQIVTERPPANVPIQGIDLPSGAIVMPVGHHATVRVVLPHTGADVRPAQLSRLPPPAAVANGWLAVVQQASRVELPDEALVEAITAARCDLLLAGPVDQGDDVVGFLLDVSELGRLGDGAEGWMSEITDPIASIARTPGSDIDVALQSCARLALSAGDKRAANDIARLLARRVRDRIAYEPNEVQSTSFSDLRRGESVGRFVAETERQICDRGNMLPSGLPSRWLGTNLEVHGIPTGPLSSVSFAVRWHGERPAVLWEQQGDQLRLSAPSIDSAWSTDDRAGEALWAALSKTKKLGVLAGLTDSGSESSSFG